MYKDHSDVLLVEDDPDLRLVLAALLAQQGNRVQIAEDGLSALAAMESSVPDIIISDLNMPLMSGFEFLSTVRQNFPAIPLVAMSGAYSGKQMKGAGTLSTPRTSTGIRGKRSRTDLWCSCLRASALRDPLFSWERKPTQSRTNSRRR